MDRGEKYLSLIPKPCRIDPSFTTTAKQVAIDLQKINQGRGSGGAGTVLCYLLTVAHQFGKCRYWIRGRQEFAF
jgi:hypothetical protein